MPLKRSGGWMVILLGVVCLIGRPAHACTAFLLNHHGHRLLGANLDWPSGDGIVAINKRGLHKTAVSDPDRQLHPAQWVGRYGSVTLNQYAVDWAWAGMNEAGLAGTALLMRWTAYPPPDHRPSIFALQWLQYQLDTSASVAEVLDRLASIRIRPLSNHRGVHFFLCDRSGDAAVVDFIDGRPLVYHGSNLPVPAMANDPYAASRVYLQRFKGYGGTLPVSNSNLSKDRFVRAAEGIAGFAADPPQAAPDAAFGLLDRLAIRSHGSTQTQWQVVFDLSGRRITYRTRDTPRRQTIDVEPLDFACDRPVQMRPVDDEGGGFADYTVVDNRRMVERFFKRYPLNPTQYEARVDRIARYPDSFVCR